MNAKANEMMALAMQRMQDSIARVAREKARRDSVAAARSATKVAAQSASPAGTARSDTKAPTQQETKTAAAAPPPEAPKPAKPDSGGVYIGSRTPNAVLYINNTAIGLIAALAEIRAPAGSVRLTIKAEGCTPWDSIVTVGAEAVTRIGRRQATCP